VLAVAVALRTDKIIKIATYIYTFVFRLKSIVSNCVGKVRICTDKKLNFLKRDCRLKGYIDI